MKTVISEAARAAKNDYFKQYKRSMTPEARQKANEYQKEWRRRNPDKVKAYTIDYWERKANTTESIEIRIKNLHQQGMSLRDIAREFGVSHMTVKRILQ